MLSKSHWYRFIAICCFLLCSTSYSATNLALKAHAWASSEALPAQNAVNGNPNLQWSSTGVTPSWLAVDLGSTATINNVTIEWDASNAELYELQGSHDAKTWTTIHTKTDGIHGTRTDSLDVNASYRYLRIYATKPSAATDKNYAIWSVKVYGAQVETIQLPAVKATASSELRPAANAIDKNPATRWESTHKIDPAWISIDFGKPYVLATITINWEVANAADYQVQGSLDGESWTVISTVTGGRFGNRTDNLKLNGIFRHLRIYGTKRSTGNNWGYSIWEIAVYGSEVPPPPKPVYIPLYDQATNLEPDTVLSTPTALITRFSDRGRDRHAREDQFHAYDHYLPLYWMFRTNQIEIIDEVAKGGKQITFNVRTLWPLNSTDLRAFYRGVNTVAEYHLNAGMTRDINDPLAYKTIIKSNTKEKRALQIGDRMEVEISLFLKTPPEGRSNYYGTAFLYIVGQGIVPWEPKGIFGDATTEREDSYPLPVSTWLGGTTTVHQQTSAEPADILKQMAANTAPQNGQLFMTGRRLHHTDMFSGAHSEQPNPVFTEMANKLKGSYINKSCISCHKNNGRSLPPAINTVLKTHSVKVGDSSGNPHPQLGRVLQPQATNGQPEGSVVIQSWTEENGLRKPNYVFTGPIPAQFSARITPQLVGLGLLEAIPESAIEALADPNANHGPGILGHMNIVTDSQTGQPRVGRFGWKAGKATVKQQIAQALNDDMAVMTSILPQPNCTLAPENCVSGEQLSDAYLDALTTYVELLGVRAQRDYQDPLVKQGEATFSDIGCTGCHVQSFVTSPFHPKAELRNQIIHPYTDLLVHDMGPGLADNLAEANAKGSEWRTAPLWNIGLTAGVSGGEAYLHDGRARSIEEAILWHGGEGSNSKNAYVQLSPDAKSALLKFIKSL
jgi:CxxC motif-containing protein (DUF1111 family)